MAMAIGDADITKWELTSNPEPVVDADGVRAREKKSRDELEHPQLVGGARDYSQRPGTRADFTPENCSAVIQLYLFSWRNIFVSITAALNRGVDMYP